MNTWLCVPSARAPHETTFSRWKDMGYKIAVFRDIGAPLIPEADYVIVGEYPGYSQATNRLCKEVLAKDPQCDWVVGGGDDVEPDPNKTADDIAAECSNHFYCAVELAYPPSRPPWSDIPIPSLGGSGKEAPSWKRWSTFGVMQPTGDPWRDVKGRIIERIAGSPWMGREFCRRMYQGQGPFWPEYAHCFGDEELQNVAQKLGVFWQRPDLTHYHHHWSRKSEIIPAHLAEATSRVHWVRFKALFEARRAAGFPGSEPIP
jgi:hypothetical protein